MIQSQFLVEMGGSLHRLVQDKNIHTNRIETAEITDMELFPPSSLKLTLKGKSLLLLEAVFLSVRDNPILKDFKY